MECLVSSKCVSYIHIGTVTFVIGEVWTIVFALSALNRSRHLRNDVGRTFVGAAHVAQTRSASLSLRGTLNALRDGLERVLEGVILVGVGAGT